MKTVEQVIEYWTGRNGIQHQSSTGRRFPDGDEGEWIPEWCKGMVCEVGCGTGRVSQLFTPDLYIGVDINAAAVREATTVCPAHTFALSPWDAPLPAVDTYLFYTVLLHIPDAELVGQLERMQLPARAVVYESMGKKLRRRKNTDGFGFQREPEQYAKVFEKVGMKVVHVERRDSENRPGFRHLMVFEGGPIL